MQDKRGMNKKVVSRSYIFTNPDYKSNFTPEPKPFRSNFEAEPFKTFKSTFGRIKDIPLISYKGIRIKVLGGSKPVKIRLIHTKNLALDIETMPRIIHFNKLTLPVMENKVIEEQVKKNSLSLVNLFSFRCQNSNLRKRKDSENKNVSDRDSKADLNEFKKITPPLKANKYNQKEFNQENYNSNFSKDGFGYVNKNKVRHRMGSIPNNQFLQSDNLLKKRSTTEFLCSLPEVQKIKEEDRERQEDYKVRAFHKKDNLLSKKVWEYHHLFSFIKLFYESRVYRPELIDKFNDKELSVFCRLINIDPSLIHKSTSKEQILSQIKEIFFGVEEKKKGYKITNNKRFVFRKIKGLMIAMFNRQHIKMKMTKRERDELFFFYYFQNSKEYLQFSEKEKKDLRKFMSVYMEANIELVWRFPLFVKDFTIIFRNFREELKLSYFKKKLEKYRAYLIGLRNKDLIEINKTTLPFQYMPLNHNTIDQYIEDFYGDYGMFLNSDTKQS